MAEQMDMFKPSESEIVYMENKLVDVLNTVVKSFGLKLETDGDIETYLWRIAEKKDFGFPDIDRETLCEIVERISERAQACGFPQQDVPKKEVRVTMLEIVERTNVTAQSVLLTEQLLTTIGDFMESCGDPRGERFIELSYLINEMIVEPIDKAKK